MSILVPNNTVTPKSYETRYVGGTIKAITVETSEGFTTVNDPRTVYWMRARYGYALTIRANDPKNTFRGEANEFAIVTIFYKDGRIEADADHIDSLD